MKENESGDNDLTVKRKVTHHTSASSGTTFSFLALTTNATFISQRIPDARRDSIAYRRCIHGMYSVLTACIVHNQRQDRSSRRVVAGICGLFGHGTAQSKKWARVPVTMSSLFTTHSIPVVRVVVYIRSGHDYMDLLVLYK